MSLALLNVLQVLGLGQYLESFDVTSTGISPGLILRSLNDCDHQAVQIDTTMTNSQDNGVTGAAKFVTSTLGNTVGGLSRTVGGVTGAATRGIGDTITGATGSMGKPVGDALANAGTGLENGSRDVARGVEDAGNWKSGGTSRKF
ncbi:hypothetical protein LTR05_007480 [Lithohypha guttulata]|uniref:Uncharacterized protein n=1 Tax=Lithohypha guttulata TaxID=1690604 RepID=A0AAN7SV71_9EURO|nr:hypothetical protein LTR05_007480 [Lithohypha guttulata]